MLVALRWAVVMAASAKLGFDDEMVDAIVDGCDGDEKAALEQLNGMGG